jgi:hypothetical protein
MAAGFTVRSTDRDREADRDRFGKADLALADLASQLEKERAGLELRYQRMVDDAGFSVQALEDRGKVAMSSRVDELAQAMKAYRARMEELKDHAAAAAAARRRLHDYMADRDLMPL